VAAVTARGERRRADRTEPDQAGWRTDAVLRPGLRVRVVNIGAYGVLVECRGRLRPGRPVELQLVSAATDRKQMVAGRMERCEVVQLQPLGFCGAIAFERAQTTNRRRYSLVKGSDAVV
jgi:hypothetical protein